jgi:hypothetical protein
MLSHQLLDAPFERRARLFAHTPNQSKQDRNENHNQLRRTDPGCAPVCNAAQ